MLHSTSKLIVVIGEGLLLAGGVIPLLEVWNRSKHRRNRWLLQQFVRFCKEPGYLQFEGTKPIYIRPKDKHSLEIFEEQYDRSCEYLVLFSASMMLTGCACVVAYHVVL